MDYNSKYLLVTLVIYKQAPTPIPTPVQCSHPSCEARPELVGTCYYEVKLYCKSCGKYLRIVAGYYSHDIVYTGTWHICTRCGYKYK